jgi:hypothetical protein
MAAVAGGHRLARASRLVPLMALALWAGAAVAAEVPPPADGNPLSGDLYNESFKVLFKLFIVAVVLEQALALVFNWKPFRELLDERATKPLGSFVFAALLVYVFNLDILADLLALYTKPPSPHGFLSGLLTALILGGGSSAVNNLMTNLGLRPVRQPPATPRPAPTKAWIAVTAYRAKAVGTVSVIGERKADGKKRALGAVSVPPPARSILSYFLKNPGRFPPAGGHELDPDEWTIYLEGVDANGVAVTSAKWGPYMIDAGAVIDLVLTV